MKRTIEITSINHANDLLERIDVSATEAKAKISELLKCENAHEFMYSMKFYETGRDPLEDRDLNIIEQLNQQFTYITSLVAVKLLFKDYPELSPFTVNLGTASGFDIESNNGVLKSEVFSSANPRNNNKLRKDVKRLFESDGEIKIVFYHAPTQHSGEEKLMKEYPGVEIKYLEKIV